MTQAFVNARRHGHAGCTSPQAIEKAHDRFAAFGLVENVGVTLLDERFFRIGQDAAGEHDHRDVGELRPPADRREHFQARSIAGEVHIEHGGADAVRERLDRMLHRRRFDGRVPAGFQKQPHRFARRLFVFDEQNRWQVCGLFRAQDKRVAGHVPGTKERISCRVRVTGLVTYRPFFAQSGAGLRVPFRACAARS